MSETVETLPQEEKDTIPEKQNEVFIPVKYNKQIMNLDVISAANLAQKGLKFESICGDYEKLKKLALNEGKSVSEFIDNLQENMLSRKKEILTQKCGGDRDLAEHILKLESKDGEEIRGFSELREKFPKFKSIEYIPESVVENAKLKGSLLLDEYLRYKLEQEIAVKNSNLQQASAKLSSTGSQQSKKGNYNPEATEFLKGLWNK